LRHPESSDSKDEGSSEVLKDSSYVN